ncbi:hypothetical protein [Acidithiobacillus caldus]|uniref:hypothetical protein n=1 Tax=Acidithiobacillus caldus TaxID=33059 RepID=UPI00146FAB85|nr:hypothetical protein [Acidithiobacillus caldus]MBU2728803.1 hypothetical protein [Acidithiobacillus caldus]MBU2778969.1 hypothetical protein [Acidithiobacillus caldus]
MQIAKAENLMMLLAASSMDRFIKEMARLLFSLRRQKEPATIRLIAIGTERINGEIFSFRKLSTTSSAGVCLLKNPLTYTTYKIPNRMDQNNRWYAMCRRKHLFLSQMFFKKHIAQPMSYTGCVMIARRAEAVYTQSSEQNPFYPTLSYPIDWRS